MPLYNALRERMALGNAGYYIYINQVCYTTLPEIGERKMGGCFHILCLRIDSLAGRTVAEALHFNYLVHWATHGKERGEGEGDRDLIGKGQGGGESEGG